MRLKIILPISFILIYGMFVFTKANIKNNRIELELSEQVKNLETHYLMIKDYFLTDARSIRDRVRLKSNVIELFSQAQDATDEEKIVLRNRLYNIVKPLYDRIHSRGILQFQFVLPNNESFLRVHKPTKYGDDLTDIRYSFKYANEQKKEIEGFEQGRTAHGFRYVFPFYDKKNSHLGSTEISLSSNSIENKLLNVNKIHSHFLVNKSIFSVKAWETKDLITKYIPSIEHKDYMFTLTNHSDIKKLQDSEKSIIAPLKDEIYRKMPLGKSFALYIEYKNSVKVVTFLPIKNAQKDKVVAYIVAYTDNHNIYNICKNYRYSNIFVFLGMLVLFYFVYKDLNYKQFLKSEIDKKTKVLNELNSNLELKIKDEVDKNRQQQLLMMRQNRLAQMGEMISMIAHQWRQPLNNLTFLNQLIAFTYRRGNLNDENMEDFNQNAKKQIEDMSQTIKDFSNFFKPQKEMRNFCINKVINSIIEILNPLFSKYNLSIEFINIKDTFETNGFENELRQALINIINNSKDALIENGVEDKKIKIQLKEIEGKVIISISDNGGGIDEEIMNKIFDPYFTTKGEKNGTGLGLYMAKLIIEDHMDGKIVVINRKNGVVFDISLKI